MRRNIIIVTLRRISSASAAIGVFLITLAAVAAFDGWNGQRTAWRQLMSAQAADPPPSSSRATSTSSSQNRRPVRGDSIASLQIERLHLSVAVLEGSDDAVLKKGPGHIEDTAYPGEPGNVAIAGHRDTHFRPLRNIRLKDEIVVTAKGSSIRYVVESIHIIKPTEMEILDPTSGPALTLVTCFPFEFIGSAPMRFIVRATPRGEDFEAKANANR